MPLLPSARRRNALVLLLTAVLVTPLVSAGSPAYAAYPDPGRVTGDITGVHDPAMIKVPNGTYLLISTGGNLQIRTSTDRIGNSQPATGKLGINLLGWDGGGWPYVY
jgi:arabinan endo-1,5-alpha-L-arabinosidase